MFRTKCFCLLLFAFFSAVRSTDDCLIPNQTPSAGQCIETDSCGAYVSLRNKVTFSVGTISFLRRITCPMAGQVCCPVGVNAAYHNPTVEIDRDKVKVRKIPAVFESRFGDDAPSSKSNGLTINEEKCGSFTTNKIIGGEIAGLEDFPWTALLLYNSSLRYGCSGAIISKRYILTAAHCVAGRNASQGVLTGVRLGEYDTQGDPDCIQEFDGYDCADDVREYMVEKVIVHPYYDPSSVSLHHDIALLKLTKLIQYSLYIAPICLPDMGDSGISHGQKMVIAGWGRTDRFQSRLGNILSPIKLYNKVPVVNQTACQEAFKDSGLKLGIGQFCAGGAKNIDSCPGDSGGALMYYSPQKTRYVASGLVSLGKTEKGQLGCGAEGFPGVYTRTDQYVQWIQNAMQNN